MLCREFTIRIFGRRIGFRANQDKVSLWSKFHNPPIGGKVEKKAMTRGQWNRKWMDLANDQPLTALIGVRHFELNL